MKLKKAQAVKQNSPVDCFVGLWCAVGYRMQSIGSTNTKDLQRKALSCHPHQISELTVLVCSEFVFIAVVGLEA